MECLKHTCVRHDFDLGGENEDLIRKAHRTLTANGVSPLCGTSGLLEFKKLKTLHLDWFSVLTQALSDPSLAPSALEMYHLSIDDSWKDLLTLIFAISPSVSIGHLELHGSPPDWLHKGLARRFMTSVRAEALLVIAHAMKKRGVTTRLVFS